MSEPARPQKIVTTVVFLANRTTLVELRGGRRIFGEKKEISKTTAEALFLEILEEGIKMDVPARMCAQGHRLEFELELNIGAKVLRFPAQGVVERTESSSHGHDSISIKFTRYDQTIWSLILSLYLQQQAAVTDLFKRLKGV